MRCAVPFTGGVLVPAKCVDAGVARVWCRPCEATPRASKQTNSPPCATMVPVPAPPSALVVPSLCSVKDTSVCADATHRQRRLLTAPVTPACQLCTLPLASNRNLHQSEWPGKVTRVWPSLLNPAVTVGLGIADVDDVALAFAEPEEDLVVLLAAADVDDDELESAGAASADAARAMMARASRIVMCVWSVEAQL